MPGPQFVPCPICHRQIMPHSLAVHESKCLEKWDLENNTAVPNSTSPPNRMRQKLRLSPTKKRHLATAAGRPVRAIHSQFGVVGTKAISPKLESTQLIQNSPIPITANQTGTPAPLAFRPQRAGSMDENSGKRPATVTLSPGGRSASLDRAASTDPNAAATCMCYVCGQKFDRAAIETHEKKCIHTWQCQVAKFPPSIRVYKPQKLQHPSVDGTVDFIRLDALAQQSSQRSQKVDCVRCRKTGIDLVTAREHVRLCGTKKPDNIQRIGNPGKRKKPKEREIYVSIFA